MIPVHQPYIGKEELKYVTDCIKRGMISGILPGEYIEKFERLVSRSCGAKYGVSTTSGTTALALAVASCKIGPGDEVLVPALTNIATAFAVVYSGAKPVFLDSENVTWNVDPDRIRPKITKRTRAIIPVHLYGHPVDMNPILKLAKEFGLWVIEDAAEAQGAEYRGKRVGGIGDIGCLSFFSNKVMTTGEGGMLVTNDREMADRARFLKNLGYSKRDKFLHAEIAYNFRLTNIQAACGVAQMQRLDKILEMKRQVARKYTERLRLIPSLQLPVEQLWAKNIYWMYGIVLGNRHPNRQVVRDRLNEMGIETRNFFHPMHQQPVFKKMGIVSREDSLPVCERLGKRGFYLPSSPTLTEKQIETICRKLMPALTD